MLLDMTAVETEIDKMLVTLVQQRIQKMFNGSATPAMIVSRGNSAAPAQHRRPRRSQAEMEHQYKAMLQTLTKQFPKWKKRRLEARARTMVRRYLTV